MKVIRTEKVQLFFLEHNRVPLGRMCQGTLSISKEKRKHLNVISHVKICLKHQQSPVLVSHLLEDRNEFVKN